MRNRFVSIAVAAAVAVSGFTAPVAFAADDTATQPLPTIKVDSNSTIESEFKTKFTLPTAKPQDVILQVGETQDSVMLNWITAKGIEGQSVRVREAGSDASTAKTTDAKSATTEINLSEGYPSDPKVKQYRTDVAHHKATITGLKENTKYTYQVGSEKDGWSEEYTFNTGTYGNKWNFLFFGDVQLYNTHDLDEEAASWKKTVSQGVEKYPDTSFLLSAGDQANHSALVEHSKFIEPEQMRQYRVGVNNGNHDNYHKPSYDAMYNRPTQGDENYWFEYNNTLVVSLDSNDWRTLTTTPSSSATRSGTSAAARTGSSSPSTTPSSRRRTTWKTARSCTGASA